MVKILSIDDCQFWLSWWNLSQKRRRSRLAARISHQRRHRYDQFQQVRLQACVPEEQNKQTADRSNAACGLFWCCFTVSTLSAAEQLCNLVIRYSRLRCILRPRHLPEPQIAGKASCKPLAGYAQRCNPIAGVEAISWHSRPSSHDWLVAQTAHQQMQQALRQHQQPTLQQLLSSNLATHKIKTVQATVQTCMAGLLCSTCTALWPAGKELHHTVGDGQIHKRRCSLCRRRRIFEPADGAEADVSGAACVCVCECPYCYGLLPVIYIFL